MKNAIRPLADLIVELNRTSRLGRSRPRLATLAAHAIPSADDARAIAEWIPTWSECVQLERALGYLATLNQPDMRCDPGTLEAKLRSTLQSLGSQGKQLMALVPHFRKPPTPASPRHASYSAKAPSLRNVASRSTSPNAPAGEAPRFRGNLAAQLGHVRLLSEDDKTITIYIDESWPTASRQFGVLAGIVWMASRPKPAVLPIPQQHRRARTPLINAFQKLAACPHAIPFCFRFHPPAGMTREEAYEHMVHECLLVILGWLIPSQAPTLGGRIGVHIVCEAIDNVYSDGYSQAELFRGVLAQAARRNPGLFSQWNIEELTWVQKLLRRADTFSAEQLAQQGYLAYGDMLAYLMLGDQSFVASRVADEVKIEGFRNLITLSPGLADVLETLHHDAPVDPGKFLDVMAPNIDSPFMQTVMDRLRVRWQTDARVQTALLAEMDARYLAKPRDLTALDRQFQVIRRVIGNFPQDASRRLHLLDVSVQLQRLSHFGDPLKHEELERRYADLRQRALDNGEADVVAHIDLFLAVRAAGRFEPEQARLIVDDLLLDENRLSLATRGKARSSLGQYLAMMHDHDEARRQFDLALSLFEKADVPDEERVKELDQTAVYRAFNSLITKAADAGDLVQSLAETYGLDETVASQYRLHLWLRYLYSWPEYQTRRSEYTQTTSCETFPWHPWELISMYRGLFFREKGSRDDAKRCFDAALDIAFAEGHGPTLAVIGSTIGTVGWLALGSLELRDRALGSLDGSGTGGKSLETLLPRIAHGLELLREILTGPAEPQRVDEALAILPFNYR